MGGPKKTKRATHRRNKGTVVWEGNFNPPLQIYTSIKLTYVSSRGEEYWSILPTATDKP